MNWIPAEVYPRGYGSPLKFIPADMDPRFRGDDKKAGTGMTIKAGTGMT